MVNMSTNGATPDAGATPAPAPRCELPQVSYTGDHCAWLRVDTETASSTSDRRANDHDSCTAWDSEARAPQTYAFDVTMGRQPLTKIVLMPKMATTGSVLHVVESTADRTTWTERARFDGMMKDATSYELPLKASTDTIFRIRTLRSPSPVAWREVEAVACRPHLRIPPPAVAYVACRSDSDCYPEGCGCGPANYCVAHPPGLPGCNPAAGGCVQKCGRVDCGNGDCLCKNGKCEGWSVVPAGDMPNWTSDGL